MNLSLLCWHGGGGRCKRFCKNPFLYITFAFLCLPLGRHCKDYTYVSLSVWDEKTQFDAARLTQTPKVADSAPCLSPCLELFR